MSIASLSIRPLYDLTQNQYVRTYTPLSGALMCYCMGPQPGHKLCPCMEASKNARRAAMREEILLEMRQRFAKPRVRVKAGSRPMQET